VLGDAAVRVDFIKGCRSAGTTHYESAERASEAVERALETAVSDRSAAARTDEADA
jgi:predicted RNase H-like HicB family nuclease